MCHFTNFNYLNKKKGKLKGNYNYVIVITVWFKKKDIPVLHYVVGTSGNTR